MSKWLKELVPPIRIERTTNGSGNRFMCGNETPLKAVKPIVSHGKRRGSYARRTPAYPALLPYVF